MMKPAEVLAETGDGRGDNEMMVESKRRKMVEGMPGGGGGIVAGSGMNTVAGNDGYEANGEGAATRVAVDAGEGADLKKGDVPEACFLGEFTGGTLFRCFVHIEEATGESPMATVGVTPATDEKDLDVVGKETEDNAVGGDGGTGVAVSVERVHVG